MSGKRREDATTPHTTFERALIAAFLNNLIDLDLVVDDRRHDVDRAVDELRQAVQRRDDVASQLRRLCEAAA